MLRSPLKIALMSSQINWGGGEHLLYSLGESLHRLGHQVLWIAPRSSRLLERVRPTGMEAYEIAGRHPTPRTLFKLRRLLHQRGVEILHGNDTHAITWGSLLSFGRASMKIFGVKHTVFPVGSAMKYNWMVDRVICVSHAVRDVCIDGGILAKQLAVVHGGIEPPKRDRLSERKLACAKLGIELDIPLYCAVGNLLPCKGYDTLVDAAAQLRKRIGHFKLVICGEGIMRNQLQAMIDAQNLNDHVELLGFCEDPTSWIAASDVFVHPTHSEGLSLVSIAAQMVGTPIVATEVGGLREVLRCQESSKPLGWILGSRCPSELAELLDVALNDREKRQQIIHDAQQSAMQHFTLEQMVNGFLNAYTDASESKRTPMSVRVA